jgi:hypothetical protein
MIKCSTCGDRKRRVITVKEKAGKKFMWVKKCVVCKTALEMEDCETGTQKNDKDR